ASLLRHRIALRLGNAPIDYQRLSKPAEHDVLRLQVAMNDAAAMGVRNGIAGVDQALQQPAKRDLALARLPRGRVARMEPLDGLLERLPFDQSHRVIRPAIGVSAQTVNRHDPRMLQPSRDLGFKNEPGLADWIMRMVGPKLLER